jgi:hypothetical protein
MSSEFNEMEQMFADGLRDYEVTPPAHVWTNIQKQKRKGLFLYKWRIASMVLLLSIAGISAYYFITKDSHSAANSTANNETVIIEENENVNHDPIGSLNNTKKTNPEVIISHDPSSPEMQKREHDGNMSSKAIDLKSKKLSKSSTSNNPFYLSDQEKSKGVEENDDAQNLDMSHFMFNLKTKKNVRFRYLIYPSLIRYVYTTKRMPKKYLNHEKEEKNDSKKEEIKLENRWAIEILGGPSYVYRKLSGKGADLRNESESASLSTQTAVKVNYSLTNNWFIQSGLIFENRKEKIKYNREFEHQNLIQTPRQVKVFHPVLPPHSMTIIDSTYSKENVTVNFNQMNSYSTFSIPMSLGYNVGFNRMKCRVVLGSLFNIFAMNSAQNLVEKEGKVVLSAYKESPKMKTSLYGSLGIQYPLNAQYNWITELSYYTNLSNRFGVESAIQQKNYGYNFSTGLQINLKK